MVCSDGRVFFSCFFYIPIARESISIQTKNQTTEQWINNILCGLINVHIKS